MGTVTAIILIIVLGMWAAGDKETDDDSTDNTKIHICVGYCPHREDEEEEDNE